MTQAANLTSQTRVSFMDSLRGFALFGIFIANLEILSLYFDYRAPEGIFFSFDEQVQSLQAMLVEGKFYSIFSFLFGWGISMQWKQFEAKGLNPTVMMKRRLVGMLLLGFFHLYVLWIGDIVAFYAMLGFVLLLFRRKSDQALYIWAFFLLLSPILLYAIKMNFLWANAPAGALFELHQQLNWNLNHLKPEDAPLDLNQTSDWIHIWKHNVSDVPFRFAYLFFVSRISKVLGMFLLGYVMGRSGAYALWLQNKKKLGRTALLCFAIGLPMSYGMAYFGSFHEDYFNLKLNGFYYTVFYALSVVPLAIAYMCSLGWIYHTAWGSKILAWMQPVGKMAFTNYLLQTITGITVFYGVGFALGGQLGPTAWTLFALGVFVLQMIISSIWLKYFQFGPVEWLWRSMTYRQWQPFRKTAGA